MSAQQVRLAVTALHDRRSSRFERPALTERRYKLYPVRGSVRFRTLSGRQADSREAQRTEAGAHRASLQVYQLLDVAIQIADGLEAAHQIAEVEKDLPFAFTGLSVSPAGEWITYPQVDEQNSRIMLVENFRW